jgi:hypothetical protein
MPKTPTLAEDLFERIKSQTDPAAYLKAMADPASPTFESDFLDFKAKPDPDPKDKNLKEIWYEALSGFGNSGGGVLIWGIDARKEPATGIDAASDVKPIKNPFEFKSRLIELQRAATDPPLGDVRIEAWETSPGAGEGFVVCLVPSGPFKPYRAEIAGKKQFFMRAVDTFYVPSVAVLRALFYPQSVAVFEVHARLQVCQDPDRIAAHPEERILTRCEIEVKNIGTATANSPHIVVHIDPQPERDPVSLGPAWVGGRPSPEKWAGDRIHPVHPDSKIPLFTLRWLTPVAMRSSPRIRLGFEFYAENQPRQAAEVVFEAERFFGAPFERSQSTTASEP